MEANDLIGKVSVETHAGTKADGHVCEEPE
jgi:hypothetical protein